MTVYDGSHTVEIDAPLAKVWAIAEDVERAPQWQGTMKTAEVLERDGEGRAALVRTTNDGKVATQTLVVRFSYDEPRGMRWVRESGDLKSLEGSWSFEDLGDGRTRATYSMALDPGRMLSMLAKGPVIDQIRKHLTERPARGLKERAENG